MDGDCKGLATYWTMNRKYLVPHLGLSREWTFHLAVNFPLVELSRLLLPHFITHWGVPYGAVRQIPF